MRSSELVLTDAEHLAFTRGFVAYLGECPFKYDKPPEWQEQKIGELCIWAPCTTRITVIHTALGYAGIIGDAYCLTDNTSVESTLIDLLKHKNWRSLDSLSGRFAAIICTPSAVQVCQDAFGARTVYYIDNGNSLSSHSALLARFMNFSVDKITKQFVASPEYAARGVGYLPGVATMYKEIFCLTPNTFLDLKLGRPKRFWPSSDRISIHKDDFLNAVQIYFQKFSDELTRSNRRPILGLTGGVDTRAVIAGLHGNNVRMRLLTWTGGRLPEAERPVVIEMAEHLKFPHDFLDPSPIAKTDIDKTILDASNISTGFCRGRSKLTLAMSTYKDINDIFIRGYGGEIIRGFYNRHLLDRGSSANFEAGLCETLSSLYITKKNKNSSFEFKEFVSLATHDYLDRTVFPVDCRGYDPLDVFYWEQRMGVWGANMHNELDSAMDSWTGVNSRVLYEMAFGLSKEYRLGKKIMLDMTSLYDKELAEMGVVS